MAEPYSACSQLFSFIDGGPQQYFYRLGCCHFKQAEAKCRKDFKVLPLIDVMDNAVNKSFPFYFHFIGEYFHITDRAVCSEVTKRKNELFSRHPRFQDIHYLFWRDRIDILYRHLFKLINRPSIKIFSSLIGINDLTTVGIKNNLNCGMAFKERSETFLVLL